MPVNYQDSKIYKLVNNVNDTVYVGSTAQKRLSARMSQHRIDANKPGVNSTIYTAMRALGLQNFSIVLLHNFPCNSKDELEAEEYRVLAQFIEVGTPHYNQRMNATGYKATTAAKKNMSISRSAMDLDGENNPAFSFGSLRYDAKANYWQFRWYENGVRKHKTFALPKYGYYGAHFRAEEFRKSIYPAYGTEEDVWCDDLGHIEW